MKALPTDLTATIPKDWTVSELGEAAHLKNGSAFKPDDWKTMGVPIVRIQNLKDRNAEFNYFQGNPDLKVPLKNGDLVFSWSGSIGTSFGPHYWWGDVAVLNQHIFRVDLKPETKLTKSFLYYALLHLTKEIESHAYGLAALVHVRKGDLEATRVPVPPLAEQRKIAEVLGLVQRAMEQQERLIAVTTELKKTLLHQLFTQGLRGEPQKQTEIGPVPKSWEVVTLQDICSLLSGGTPSKQKPEFWCGSIPWVSPKDMKKPRLMDVADHISEAALEDGSSLAPAEAVFVVIRGMILAKDVPVALAQVPMAFNQDMKAIIPGARIMPSFLLYALVAFKQRLFQKVGRSAHGTMTLMSSEIAQFNIPLPDKRTQREIASAIETIELKHERQQRKHAALTALFRTLLHQLMTAQSRVYDLDIFAVPESDKGSVSSG